MQQNMMGPNIIITEPSSSLRALGRNALTGKWKVAVIAVIIYTLCLEVPPEIINAIFGVNIGSLYGTGYGAYNVDVYSTINNSMPAYSPLSGIYTLLVTGAFSLGISLFFLALFRRQVVSEADIFLGFERFGKALGLMLFQTLFICLWLMLFIVPGIIAAIRYSQAFFILADDPNKGIRQCMDESKAMMNGNKAKYFCLSISFIGWLLLTAVPMGILSAIGETLFLQGIMAAIFAIVGGLFIAPVTAYMYSTYAGFYEILSGHLIKETEPAPIAPEAIPVANQYNEQSQSTAAPEPEVDVHQGMETHNTGTETPVSTAVASDEKKPEVPTDIEENK